MFIEKADEPPFAQRSRRDSRVHVTRARIPPWAAPVKGRRGSARLVKATPHQLLRPSAWSLPLPPQKAAQSAAKPRVELVTHDA
jgi:hypothetical protein